MRRYLALRRLWALVYAGQDVQHHVPARRTGGKGLGACGGHRFQSIDGYGAQDAHELPVAVRSPAKSLPDLPERFGQIPSLEGRAVTQRPRLVFQYPKVVPCVIDHPVAAELPPVFPDNLAVTDHYYPVGVCTYHRRPAYSRGVHTVAVPVIRHKRRSRYPGRCLPVAVKRGAHGHKLLLLLGETRGYRALPELGMLMPSRDNPALVG